MLDKGIGIPVRAAASGTKGAVSSMPSIDDQSNSARVGSDGRSTLFRKRPKKQDDVDWKSVAARLQADMVNYRKRQEGRANDEVLREKMRLLREFLGIMDQFEAALGHIHADDPVHTGVQMAYDAMVLLLDREGVERIPDVGFEFDPAIHEAVAQLRAQDRQDGNWIVEVVQTGYTIQGRLLRPAKVVVSVAA